MRTTLFALMSICGATTGCGDGQLVETYELIFDVDNETALVDLENSGGDLEVEGSNRNDVEVRAELRTWRIGAFEDEEAEDAVILEGDEDDGVLELITVLDDPPSGYYLDVTVLVPDRMRLRLSDDSGDAVVEGLSGLDVEDGSGDLYVTDISGEVHIVDDSGDIEVVDVEQAVFIEDESGDISVYDVDDDVTIRDGSGDIFVRSVDGTVTLWDGSGDIDVRDVGEVLIKEDESGDIDID